MFVNILRQKRPTCLAGCRLRKNHLVLPPNQSRIRFEQEFYSKTLSEIYLCGALAKFNNNLRDVSKELMGS